MDSLVKKARLFQQSKHSENKVQLGDQIAEEIAPKLWTYLARRCPLDEVEDLRQDILVAVLIGLGKCQALDNGQFWGWVYGIANNKLATRLKNMGREFPIDDQELWRLVEASGDVEPITHNERQELEETWSALRGLSEYERKCLELRYLEDLTYKEIGVELRSSADAVRMTIARAEKETEQLLKGKC